MNYPAASCGVSNRSITIKRSKLRGIKPEEIKFYKNITCLFQSIPLYGRKYIEFIT